MNYMRHPDVGSIAFFFDDGITVHLLLISERWLPCHWKCSKLLSMSLRRLPRYLAAGALTVSPSRAGLKLTSRRSLPTGSSPRRVFRVPFLFWVPTWSNSHTQDPSTAENNQTFNILFICALNGKKAISLEIFEQEHQLTAALFVCAFLSG